MDATSPSIEQAGHDPAARFAALVEQLGGVRGTSGVEHSGGRPRRRWDQFDPHQWALIADQMAIDPQVSLASGVVFSEVLGATPKIVKGTTGRPEDEPLAERLAEFAREVFGVEDRAGLTRRPLDAWMKDIVWSLYYGSLPFEVEWDPRDPRTGHTIPVDLHPRIPSSIERWGDGDRFGPVTQRLVSGAPPPKPMAGRKLLLFSVGQLGTDYLGRGLARAAWSAYQRRRDLQDYRQIGCSRLGLTPPKVRQDPAVIANQPRLTETLVAELVQKQVDNVCAVQAGGNTCLVEIAGVTDVNFGTSDGFDPTKLMAAERLEVEEIYAAFGVLFLALGINGEGNRSLGEVHMNLLRRAAVRYAELIAATFNGAWRDGGGLIGALIELNFGPVDPRLLPKLVLTGLEPNALAEALGTLPGLADKGYLTPEDNVEDAIRTALDLPPRTVSRSIEERMLSGAGAVGPVYGALARARAGQATPQAAGAVL